MDSPAAAKQEMCEAEEEGKDRPDSHVESPVHSPPSMPGPRLGEDMEAYVLQPAPQGHVVQCRISRNKRGVDRGMFPFYYLYLEAEEGLKVWPGPCGRPALPIPWGQSHPFLCTVRVFRKSTLGLPFR